jgi:hypothetical protein
MIYAIDIAKDYNVYLFTLSNSTEFDVGQHILQRREYKPGTQGYEPNQNNLVVCSVLDLCNEVTQVLHLDDFNHADPFPLILVFTGMLQIMSSYK